MITKTGFWRTRIFLILTAMTLFVGCQKDDEASSLQSQEIQESNSFTVISKVSTDEIPKIMNYLTTKGDRKGQFTITKQNNDTRSNEPDLVIGALQTQEILKVTDQYDRSNYTFLLTSIESTDSTVKSTFNLIVKESSNGLFSYIMEYRPDENWNPDYRDSNYMTTFTGEIIFYTIDGVYIAKSNLIGGVSTSVETRNSCPDDDTGNGNGESTSDSSDSSTTTTTSDGGNGGQDITVDTTTTTCGCDPEHEGGTGTGDCTCQQEDTTVVNVKSSVNTKIDSLSRNPCPPEDTPEFCHDAVGDPCLCDADGIGCAETNPNTGFIDNLEIIFELNELIRENPYILLDIDCNQIESWQILAQHTAPQSVHDKILTLPSTLNDFYIQTLENTSAPTVNLDYFSVNVTTLPDFPNTNNQMTADEFLDYIRRNFNIFVDGSTFNPYCEIAELCVPESNLWISNDPTGAIIYIDIPGDDGVVICSEYQNDYWYFMTMNAPFAGNHPVSGTREFGYEINTDGSINFYVRGVDRFENPILQALSWVGSFDGNPFFGADNLWVSFQTKTNQFVNQNHGLSIINPAIKNRVNWDLIEDVLLGEKPISDLGCN